MNDFYCTRCNTRLYSTSSVELGLCIPCESGVPRESVFCYFCTKEVTGKMGKDASRINSDFAHNTCLELARSLLGPSKNISPGTSRPASKQIDLETIQAGILDTDFSKVLVKMEKEQLLRTMYGGSPNNEYSRDYIMELKDVPANLPESVYDITDDPAESKTVNIARRRIKLDG